MSHDGPSSGEPEYLSSDEPTTPLERSPRRGRRPALLIGGAIAIVGLAGGAAWAWAAYSSSGPQPSEALPADTLGYAAIDLDPSAKQGLEAIRTLRKFPAFRDEVDVNTGDDLRKRIIEWALEESGCDLDYDDDVEPWLGKRFAVAAVPGEKRPDPVFVLQVTDGDAASEGLTALRECGDGDDGAWEIRGEWAVVAETAEVAESTADAATESSLADDGDFQRWTGAAGDPGIITAYAAPEAGETLLDNLEDLDGPAVGGNPLAESGLSDSESAEALARFEGAAMTVRFADGALEVEGAGRGTEETGYLADSGAEVISSLPEDTAMAFGFGLEEGWADALLERIVDEYGRDAEEGITFAERTLGLELPEDLETLFGDSAAFSLGGEFDPAELEQGGLDVPAGVTVSGEADEVEDILEKLRAAVGPDAPEAGVVFQAASDGDRVSVGPSDTYRQKLLEGGDLGGTDAFGDVVPEADRAGMVFFVNFDAGAWVDNFADVDQEVTDNLEPLEAAGLSAWADDDEGHALFRLTTE